MSKNGTVTGALCENHNKAQQINQEMISPLVNPLNLFDLNDDCILEILQYLTISDTFALLGTLGRRFDHIARRRIAQLKCLTYSLRNPPKFTPNQLQIIGQHLQTLNFSVGYSLDSESCISKYFKPLCQHGAIQNLTLNYVNFKDSYQECILNLAPNLKYLDLSFCQLTDDLLRPILEQSSHLQTLVIIGNYDWKGNSLHHIKSKNLQSITLELNDYCSDDVNAYVAQNTWIVVNVYVKGRSSCRTYPKGRILSD